MMFESIAKQQDCSREEKEYIKRKRLEKVTDKNDEETHTGKK